MAQQVRRNPAHGLDRNPERPRDRFVEDADYFLVYNLAGERYPYLQPIILKTAVGRARVCGWRAA